MIIKLKDILGSLTKALDIIYVLEGDKPVSRILYNDERGLKKLLNEEGLSFEVSDFKIAKVTDKTRNYSDKGVRIGKEEEGSSFMYISKDAGLAKEAKVAEAASDHVKLGKLLGYPDCCCRFFEKYSRVAASGSNDFTNFTFAESSGIEFPWEVNNLLRGFDISLISHFPCSYHCSESKKIAHKNLVLLTSKHPDIAYYFMHALRSAVIYAEGVGVYALKARQNGNMLHYNNKEIISSNDNDLFNILKRRDKIFSVGRNEFNVGEVNIKDAQTFLALFS